MPSHLVGPNTYFGEEIATGCLTKSCAVSKGHSIVMKISREGFHTYLTEIKTLILSKTGKRIINAEALKKKIGRKNSFESASLGRKNSFELQTVGRKNSFDGQVGSKNSSSQSSQEMKNESMKNGGTTMTRRGGFEAVPSENQIVSIENQCTENSISLSALFQLFTGSVDQPKPPKPEPIKSWK